MSKSIVQTLGRKSKEKSKRVQTDWGGVLADAEASIREYKAHIRRLQSSARAIKEKIRRGEAFPCSSTQN